MSKAGIDLKFKAEGRCRLCLRHSSVRPLTRHRIVPGAAGGTYRAVNCAPLCRPCHDLVDNRDQSTKLRARRMLRASLWPIEISWAERASRQTGRNWDFDAAYPRPPREMVEERRTALSA